MPPDCFSARNRARPAFSSPSGPRAVCYTRALGRELAVIALLSCTAGAALGAPLGVGHLAAVSPFSWSTHRRCPSFLTRRPICSRLRLQPMWFACCFFLAARFIRHTNIIDIVQTSHKSEPIHAVKRWYGPVGIVLALAGALLGYLMPTFFVTGAALVRARRGERDLLPARARRAVYDFAAHGCAWLGRAQKAVSKHHLHFDDGSFRAARRCAICW